MKETSHRYKVVSITKSAFLAGRSTGQILTSTGQREHKEERRWSEQHIGEQQDTMDGDPG